MSDFSLPGSRREAQARADRIRAFEAELEEVERDGVLRLAPDERLRLASYHRALRAMLSARFDVDLVDDQKTTSLGLRLAALVGALAVTTGFVLFFFRIWGTLPVAGRVAIVVAAPLVALGGAEATSRSTRYRMASGLFVALAFGGLVLDVEVLCAVFGIAPRAASLLAYGIFAVALAYTYRRRLLLAAGAVCLACWLAAVLLSSTGAWWLDFPMRPEGLFVGAVGLAVWSAAPHTARREVGFPPVIRALTLLLIAVPVLLLSRAGYLTWIPADAEAVGVAYQVTSFVVAVAAMTIGLRRRWPEVTALGTVLFALSSFLKFVDWWWAWMPRYLFFLLVGALAFVAAWLLQRIRQRVVPNP